MPPTPIMRWLQAAERAGGATDQFNQTVLVQAPAGVTETEVAIVLQALVDRHAMLRLRVTDDGADGWSFEVPEAGSVQARDCLRSVDALSAEMLLAALWVEATGQLAVIIHHLAVDAVSWWILLEDLNIAWALHRAGQPVELAPAGTSFARWARLLDEHARDPEVVGQLDRWKTVTSTPAALPAPRPDVDTYASAGRLSVELDAETTAMLLGEVPAAFHAGIHDILLIAFGLAWTEFLGEPGAPIGIDVEGHGRHEELGADIDLSRTVGWFTAKYPVSLDVAGLRWPQVAAGDPALGPVLKRAKEQLRTLPEPLTYGLLRYLNTDVDLAGADPPIAFNYLGRQGAASDSAADGWRISQDMSLLGAAAAVPMPLMHAVELNAGTIDTGAGPHLHAEWTWAPSVLGAEQITRVSRLWFEALAGVCAHVRSGGGGLTPSDIAPARLTQQQIDELQSRHRIADILPLTPLQQGLLFHSSTAQGNDGMDDMYAVQLDFTLTGPLDADRLREAVRTVVHRHPHLAALFCDQYDEPVQIIPADPAVEWRYVELDGTGAADADDLIDRRTRRGGRSGRPAGIPHRAGAHRRRPAPVRADQPPHPARRLVAADPAARDLRRLLRAAAARRRLLPGLPHLAGRARPRRRPPGLGRGAVRFRHAHPGRPGGPVGAGPPRLRKVLCP